MPLLIPDDRRRFLLGVLATAPLWLLNEAPAAGVSNERVVWDAAAFSGNLYETLTMRLPVVRQGSTLLTAEQAEASFHDGDADNSTWKFTGAVHLEFDGAVLDAQAATVVFANKRLSSVVVEAGTAQQAKKSVHIELDSAVLDVSAATVTFANGRINTIKAQGSPAQFSHVLKKNGRRVNGRSNRIEYDAGRSLVTLSVDTWFSTGKQELETQLVTYNLADGVLEGPGKASGTHLRDERVPAPRTPDRETAR